MGFKFFSDILFCFLFPHCSPFWIKWTSRIGGDISFSFSCYLPFHLMLLKWSSALQKQMEGKFQKKWDLKTMNLLGSSLVSSFPWKQKFVGKCRHDRNPWLFCFCCPLSVSKEMDFRSCFHAMKGTHPTTSFWWPSSPIHSPILILSHTMLISFLLTLASLILLRIRECYNWKAHRNHLAQTNYIMRVKTEAERRDVGVKIG